jgi:RecA-family ATPase
MDNLMLQHALEYCDKGISIFPLIPNDKRPLWEVLPLYDHGDGKGPKPSWIPFQTEQLARERVQELWTDHPNANIAGVMGKISGAICADQDILKENGIPVLDEFGVPVERGDISGFPPTLSATTWSGGKHSMYGYVEGVLTKHGFRKMLDIQSDGSYIVLAPSIVNGKLYEWDMDWKEMWNSLPPFPKEVLPTQVFLTTPRLDIKNLISVSHGSRNDSMHKLACSLYGKGYPDEDVVFIATEVNRTYKPPLGEQQGDKPDELANTLRSAKSFVAGANQNKSKSEIQNFDLLSWKEFDAVKFPENPWRIDKLIPEFGDTLLAAPSGHKKSWVAMEMMRSIAKGDLFLGKFKTKQGNVLYIEQETPQVEIQRRGRQLGLNDLDNVWMVSSKDDPLNLNDPAVVKQLEDIVKSKNISVVFVDTFRSVAGGLKEEKAEEIRAFFNRFRKLAETGIAFVFLDHTRKPRPFESHTKPMMDQILGSQDKASAVVNVIMLGPSEEKNSFSFHQKKIKGGKENDPFTIVMRDENEGTPDQKTYLEYGGEFDEEQLKIEQAKEMIVTYLEDQGCKKTAQEIKEALLKEVGKSNADKALKYMREHDEIGHSEKGRAYLYWFPPESKDTEEPPEQEVLDIVS